MLAAYYPTKKELKLSIGKELRYGETSLSGEEFKPNGVNYVVGPSEDNRKWYAQVTTASGKIIKVS